MIKSKIGRIFEKLCFVIAAGDCILLETILLVEDDEMVKKIVFHILIQYGYTVLEAQNPQEAILICEQYKGVINLLITDVVMPEMNGYDLARKIISLYPEIKILFVSGYTEDVLYQRGVLGMDSNFSRNHSHLIHLY